MLTYLGFCVEIKLFTEVLVPINKAMYKISQEEKVKMKRKKFQSLFSKSARKFVDLSSRGIFKKVPSLISANLS